MGMTWKTKWGARRVREDPPTIEEALIAAESLTDDLAQRVEIAAALMGAPTRSSPGEQAGQPVARPLDAGGGAKPRGGGRVQAAAHDPLAGGGAGADRWPALVPIRRRRRRARRARRRRPNSVSLSSRSG